MPTRLQARLFISCPSS